jgi:hypothetical protein
MTVPMLGYLGKLGPGNSSLWSFSIKKYGPQTGSDPYQPDAGNGICTAAGNPYNHRQQPAGHSLLLSLLPFPSALSNLN